MAAVDEDELRAKLYSSLQRKGLLDSLKSQLRNSLITELQPTRSRSDSTQKLKMVSSLHHQIASYLIINYLQSHGYQYTLSTFLPEAGLRMEKLLTFDDVCHVLGLTGQEMLKACEKDQERNSLLLGLLHHLPSLLKQRLETASCGVQTDQEEKGVKAEEEEKEEDEEEEERKETIEKRMIAFQKTCETRNKRALEQEMIRFRDKELSVMRLEERNKYLKELGLAKEQIEQKYHERLASSTRCLEEERERLRRKEADAEQCLYNQRQGLLGEMETLRLRENDLKRQSELDKKAASLEREKSVSLQQLLNEKDEVLSSLKKQYEKMVEARVERQKVELETKFLHEGKKATEMKAHFEAQQLLIDGINKRYDKVTSELEHERETTTQLHKELQAASEKMNSLFIENTQLKEKLKLTDSSTLRERLRETEGHLLDLRQQTDEERSKLKKKISEQEVTVKEAKNKLSKAVKQQKETQQKLEGKLKEVQDDAMSLSQANKIFKEEIAKKMEVIFRLHDQLTHVTVEYRSSQSQIKDLKNHIDSLHDMLTSSTSNKNKNKKKQSPRRKVTTRQTSLSTPPTEMSPAPSIDVSLLGSFNQTTANDTNNDVSFSDSSAMILSEARATFARMEKESEELARYYSDYSAPPPSLPLPFSHAPLLPSLPSYLFPPIAMTTTMASTNPHLISLSPNAPPTVSLTTPITISSTTPSLTVPVASIASSTTPTITSLAPPTSIAMASAPAVKTTPPTLPPTSTVDLGSHWTSRNTPPSVATVTRATVAVTTVAATTTTTVGRGEAVSSLPATTLTNGLTETSKVSSNMVPPPPSGVSDIPISTGSGTSDNISSLSGPVATTSPYTLTSSDTLALRRNEGNTVSLTPAYVSNTITSTGADKDSVSTPTTAYNGLNLTSTGGAPPLINSIATTVQSPPLTSSTVTVLQAPPIVQSDDGFIAKSSATTAVIDDRQHRKWSSEREKRLQTRREEEERERIRIRQELLTLQRQEDETNKGEGQMEESVPMPKSKEANARVNGNDLLSLSDDEGKRKWTMDQYIASVKNQSATKHSSAHMQQQYQHEPEVLDLLSGPTESDNDDASDPFANW